MNSNWPYAADCIQALFRGGDEDKAWDGAVLVSACLLHLNRSYRRGK